MVGDGTCEHDGGDVVFVEVDELVGYEGEERRDDDGWVGLDARRREVRLGWERVGEREKGEGNELVPGVRIAGS